MTPARRANRYLEILLEVTAAEATGTRVASWLIYHGKNKEKWTEVAIKMCQQKTSCTQKCIWHGVHLCVPPAW